jgi:hypothetical protein
MVVEYSPHALSRAGSSVAALDALLDDSGYDRFTFVDRLKRLRLEGYPGLEDEDTVFNVYCIPRSG